MYNFVIQITLALFSFLRLRIISIQLADTTATSRINHFLRLIYFDKFAIDRGLWNICLEFAIKLACAHVLMIGSARRVWYIVYGMM